jgi:CubicO group peptidase (beta-lactamase class C family)
MRHRLRGAALLVGLVVAAPALAKEKPSPLAGLDAQVRRAMQEFSVPGMAVAVVKDGQVVHAKGYGVRRVGAPDAVDADTLFGIASNTKAFTCAAISILAEDGKLDWDDRVTKHLLRLPGPAVHPRAGGAAAGRDAVSYDQ